MSKPYCVPIQRLFCDMNTSTSNASSENALPITMNYQLFKIDLDTIPIFEGKETQINIFLNTIDSIIKRYIQFPESHATLRAAIFSKFRGRAAEILSPRNDLESWNDIKKAILQHFSDSRSIEQLLVEFNNIRLQKNESIIEFGYRIRTSLSKLIAKINLSNLEDKELRYNLYTSNALDRFLVSIPYNISCQIRLRQPNSLDEAITFANDEVNFMNRSFLLRNTQIQIPNKPNLSASRPNNTQQNFHQFPYQKEISRTNNRMPQNNKSLNYHQNYSSQNSYPRNPSKQFMRPNVQVQPEPMSVQTTLNCEVFEENDIENDENYYLDPLACCTNDENKESNTEEVTEDEAEINFQEKAYLNPII